MKIVNILGGLGNQMFQYAFLVALRESTGIETKYDASVFKTYPLHNGFELERRFNIISRQATSKEIRELTYYTRSYFWYRVFKRFPKRKTMIFEPPHSIFTPKLLEDKRDLYYYGIWQDHHYFDKYKSIIKQEFEWKEPLDEKNQRYYNDFVQGQTVSLHIRRGDYLKEWRYKGICELDYYQKAVAHVKRQFGPQMQYAIFSNDTEWCEENIVPLLDVSKYVNVNWNQGEESHKDLRLMQACRVNVIANSSFSWWAAYLNIHKDSIVISPKKWTNAEVLFERQLPEWVKI